MRGRTATMSGSRTARHGVARALLATMLFLPGCGAEEGWWLGTPLEVWVNEQLDQAQAAAPTETGLEAFERRVYPLLTDYCVDCHAGSGPGTPSISHPDLQTAYDVVVNNQKVNFGAPEASRLVRRLEPDSHHCWSDCAADALEMRLAIEAWAIAELAGNDGNATTVAALASASQTLADGIENEESGRIETGTIARFDFTEETGEVAFDSSGVEPPMDLALQGDISLMSSYGVNIRDGRAIATTEASRKLYDHIAHPFLGSQQFSVEAWVTAANVTQEGPARIISYSRGTGARNFTLGQVLYNYNFRSRFINPEIGPNGTPALQTADADQDLQATLQHVVVTYDQYQGRRIYVNGAWTEDMDELLPSRLWTWDPDFQFVLGQETNGSREWEGQIRFVSIFPFVMPEEHIVQNYNAGIGKRLLLRFDVTNWIGANSYVEFVVSEFDDYSYLFCEPRLFTSAPTGFRVSNLRVAVNGLVPVSGQAFVNTDRVVSVSGQLLSRQCSLVLKDQGPAVDAFSIEFEHLAEFREPVVPLPAPPPVPPEFGDALPLEGNRNFERIWQNMSAVTGVDANTPGVRDTYDELRQALPGNPDLRSFSSAQQVAISKLALEFCDAMVESVPLRDAFFGGGVDFAAPATTTFAPGSADRTNLITSLADNMLGVGIGNQPDALDLMPILDPLIDDLMLGCTPATCDAERTRTVGKAACAAVLSSAAATVH